MPRLRSVGNDVLSDEVVDRQVADMRTLLGLMTGTNAAEALAALRAALPIAVGETANNLRPVRPVP